ncbi:MAG TPA: hypothetical protein VMI10_13090 [Terriglobales bacterium]|nr:hypothetical protein [Terriglobales bacterium]
MLRRFAAASTVAAIALAVAAIVVILVPGMKLERFAPLLAIWCCAPCAWGIWAMLAPSSWVPGRLPVWGAILGVIAGCLAGFVLDLPSRVFGESVSVAVRASGVIVLVVFYSLLWAIVRAAYRKIAA